MNLVTIKLVGKMKMMHAGYSSVTQARMDLSVGPGWQKHVVMLMFTWSVQLPLAAAAGHVGHQPICGKAVCWWASACAASSS